mgnify:CR=1 FL=1|jgi:hypothetical protein
MMPEEAGDYTSSCSDDEERVLREFLEMPLEGTDAVFRKFLDLDMPGTIHEKGKGDFQEFLYIPGSRKDRVVLVAHADTYWSWQREQGKWVKNRSNPTDKDIDYRNPSKIVNRNGGLGADDRAGCAILWILRQDKGFGHSILITNGEEHGQRASNWLRDSHPQLFQELNQKHQFILQLDRHGHGNFVHYQKATKTFEKYVEAQTGYKVEVGTASDISVLCEDICGTNLCIGYYDEHCPGSMRCTTNARESLNIRVWGRTLDICRKWLNRSDLQRYELR